ncbi:MAG: SOSS complex subunit B family protein [Candidatus Nanoarchaeia archaeon]|jgi:ssDNA-binding replication factor A large subunit
MIKITKIEKLDPRVWGVTIHFIVIDIYDIRAVSFQDGSEHKTMDFLIADDSASILLNLWDDFIGLVKKGKTYEITNARLTVFNNVMKLTNSRKSEITEIKETIKPNLTNKMSEKKFQPAKKAFYSRK